MALSQKNFDPRRYPVITRVIDGYIEVCQPDFGIYRYKKRFDEIRTAEEIGNMVLDVMREAMNEYYKNNSTNTPSPPPSDPKGTLNSPTSPTLGIREVARLLQVSPDTVRRLCSDGKLTATLTRGGHRRFRQSDVEALLSSL